jgi:hypothetical protein
MLNIQYRMHPEVNFPSSVECIACSVFLKMETGMIVVIHYPIHNRLVSSLQKNFMKGYYKMERVSARNAHGIPTPASDHFVSLMLMVLNHSHLEVVLG